MKILAWIFWVLLVGGSGFISVILLAFGLQAPDHPVRGSDFILNLSLCVFGILTVVSFVAMCFKKYAIGLPIAIFLLPSIILTFYLFEKFIKYQYF